jgi:hypothetical protein
MRRTLAALPLAERHHDDSASFDVPQIVMREIHRALPISVQLTKEQTIRERGERSRIVYPFKTGSHGRVAKPVTRPTVQGLCPVRRRTNGELSRGAHRDWCAGNFSYIHHLNDS